MPSQIQSHVPITKPPQHLAALEIINFSRLLNNDPQETDKLLFACQTHGFFHLRLEGLDDLHAMDDFDRILGVMKAWFHQPAEKKLKYNIGSDKHG